MKEKLKIFLCSTSFDLEDLRALVVDRFGKKHEFVHFEDAAFPSRRGLHSHDQCIEAVNQANVVICIIDRRYGGRYHGDRKADFPQVSFKVGKEKHPVVVPTEDLSISWCELLTAYRKEKYVITFARRRTMDEKATRRKNQAVSDFKAAHVDDVRVFDLLDWITKQPKDNWIIQFDNAVDFLAKLEKWLETADKTTVPSVSSDESVLAPIVLIVEGETDAVIVKVILSKLNLRHPVSIIVAQGKRALLGNLKGYAKGFENAAGLLVLADADTNDPHEIKMQQSQFEQIASQFGRPAARLVLAVPDIEAWLGGKRPMRVVAGRHLIREDGLSSLQDNLEKKMKSIPSLRSFIEALREMDSFP